MANNSPTPTSGEQHGTFNGSARARNRSKVDALLEKCSPRIQQEGEPLHARSNHEGSNRTRAAPTTTIDDVIAAVVRREFEASESRLIEAFAALLDEARAERLLTVNELATTLKVSRSTVYSLRDKGLPTITVGDSPRFRWAAVLAWLEAGGDQR